ncbi:hypothetical protein pETSU_168 [Edwardsiella phage pEt-SU]|uniref:Uncharacterized protein n=1 Tax=Edwardsiella phage pEt-SU TaxID=2562142 RepID=A0A4D6DYK6_9CAUD|nr:hypothetical protein HOV39_gp168 [Edwardsiella phage pEt-SU]QBZ70749.1 hypothetical protein pETSU_168 [Edwardsiella phage pEt-SU]
MELLNNLNEFIHSGNGLLLVIGIVVWLGIGMVLFYKIFVMGLIGCTGKGDTPFILMYTIGCIVFWPGYLFWMFAGVIDIKAIFKKPQIKIRHKHKVTGGVYEKIAMAKHAIDISPSYPNNMLFAASKGKSGEPVMFYKRNDDTDFRYTGAINYGDIVVYKNLENNKYHLSTPEEFEQNFIKR